MQRCFDYNNLRPFHQLGPIEDIVTRFGPERKCSVQIADGRSEDFALTLWGDNQLVIRDQLKIGDVVRQRRDFRF